MAMTQTPHRVLAPILRDSAQSLKSQGDSFLLDLAHELRSPLSSFTLALDGLREDDGTLDGRDRDRLLRAMQRSTLHLQSIVDNLRDVATIGANAFTMRPVETDLGVIVREAVQIAEPLLRPSGQTIVVDLPDDATIVLVDPLRVRQVLVNLLHNAIKYGPRDDVIIVRVYVDVMVTVEVGDRGGAIPPDEQERLFDRLFRGRTAVAAPGSGMGLSIARAIVEAHGGSIGLRSVSGEWTTFWFTLHLV